MANLAEAWHRSGDAARAADLLQRAEDAADRWAQSGSHHGASWRWMLRIFRADLAWDAGDRERAAEIHAEALRDPMAGVEFGRLAERCGQVGLDVAGLMQARDELDAELTYESEASRVKLGTADGKTLWASLWEGRAGRPGIVLIPMAGHSRWNMEMFEHAPRGRWELRVVPEAGHGTYLLEVRPGLWGELLDWLGPRLTGAFNP